MFYDRNKNDEEKSGIKRKHRVHQFMRNTEIFDDVRKRIQECVRVYWWKITKITSGFSNANRIQIFCLLSFRFGSVPSIVASVFVWIFANGGISITLHIKNAGANVSIWKKFLFSRERTKEWRMNRKDALNLSLALRVK